MLSRVIGGLSCELRRSLREHQCIIKDYVKVIVDAVVSVTMGRTQSAHRENDGELSVLLVVTVIIGLALMASLLLCYACVLRRLCCGTPSERKHRVMSGAGRRTESIPMGDVTLLSSQPTESERV